MHLRVLGWIDCRSEIDESLPLCCRMLEIRELEISVFQWVAALDYDYSNVFPRTCEYVKDIEAGRSDQLGLMNRDDFMSYWHNQLSDLKTGVMAKAKLYFYEATATLGWSTIYLLDPYLGPLVATAFLSYIHGTPLPQLAVPPPFNPSIPWTGKDARYPYPGVTNVQYCEKIYSQLINNPAATEGVFSAYGLKCEGMIKELELIKAGKVLDMGLAAGITFNGSPSAYWHLSTIHDTFGCTQDSLRRNFSMVPVASVRAELMFCIANFAQKTNQLVSGASSNMAFYGNSVMPAIEKLKQTLKDEAKAIVANSHDVIPGQELDEQDVAVIHRKPARRPQRSKRGFSALATFFLAEGKLLETLAPELLAAAGPRKQNHEKKQERDEAMTRTKNAMPAHVKTGTKQFDGKMLLELIKRSMKAREEGADKFETSVVDPYLSQAKQVGNVKQMRIFLQLDDVKNLLMSKPEFKDIPFEKAALEQRHHVPMSSDPEGFISITALVAAYFAYKDEEEEEEDEDDDSRMDS